MVQHCYREFPHLSEGGLTNLKGLMVANTGLGALSEALDLPKFLSLGSDPLREAIDDFTAECAKLRAAELQKDPEERGPYWQDLSPPKACADIIESLMGAMLVDSGFDVAPGQRFFDEKIRPWIQTFCSRDNQPANNPASFIGLIRSHNCRGFRIEITDIGTLRSEAKAINTKLSKDVPKTGARCRFWLHGRMLAETMQYTRKSAVLDVCRRAIRHLQKDDWQPLKETCDCEPLSDEEKEVEEVPVHDTSVANLGLLDDDEYPSDLENGTMRKPSEVLQQPELDTAMAEQGEQALASTVPIPARDEHELMTTFAQAGSGDENSPVPPAEIEGTKLVTYEPEGKTSDTIVSSIQEQNNM